MNGVFNTYETERLSNVNFPFYDGGLSPLLVYYTNKYIIPIELNEKIKSVQGNTLFQVCNNFYKDSVIKPDFISQSIDFFPEPYLKKYYFESSFYDFNEVMIQYKNLKTSNQKNMEKIFEWIIELPNILLGFLALKENFSLGLEDKNQLDKYEIYINEITNEFLNNYANKTKMEYINIFFLFQMINPTASSILYQSNDLIIGILSKFKQNELLALSGPDDESYLFNYLNNLIVYGSIRDYLSIQNNKLSLYKKIKLNTEMFEGFENKEANNNNNNNNNKTKTKSKTKSKNDTKVIKKDYFKFILYCLLFTLILLFGIRIIIFIWPYLIDFMKNIFYKK
jgi:hypothetical protein